MHFQTERSKLLACTKLPFVNGLGSYGNEETPPGPHRDTLGEEEPEEDSGLGLIATQLYLHRVPAQKCINEQITQSGDRVLAPATVADGQVAPQPISPPNTEQAAATAWNEPPMALAASQHQEAIESFHYVTGNRYPGMLPSQNGADPSPHQVPASRTATNQHMLPRAEWELTTGNIQAAAARASLYMANQAKMNQGKKKKKNSIRHFEKTVREKLSTQENSTAGVSPYPVALHNATSCAEAISKQNEARKKQARVRRNSSELESPTDQEAVSGRHRDPTRISTKKVVTKENDGKKVLGFPIRSDFFPDGTIRNVVFFNGTRQQLPETLRGLRVWDIICGKDKRAFHNIGNRRLRVLVAAHLPRYVSTKNRAKVRSRIIMDILDSIENAHGRFLKEVDGYWEELDYNEARMKVGHAIRDQIACLRAQSKRQDAPTDSSSRVSNPRAKIVPRPNASCFSRPNEQEDLKRSMKRNRDDNTLPVEGARTDFLVGPKTDEAEKTCYSFEEFRDKKRKVFHRPPDEEWRIANNASAIGTSVRAAHAATVEEQHTEMFGLDKNGKVVPSHIIQHDGKETTIPKKDLPEGNSNELDHHAYDGDTKESEEFDETGGENAEDDQKQEGFQQEFNTETANYKQLDANVYEEEDMRKNMESDPVHDLMHEARSRNCSAHASDEENKKVAASERCHGEIEDMQGNKEDLLSSEEKKQEENEAPMVSHTLPEKIVKVCPQNASVVDQHSPINSERQGGNDESPNQSAGEEEDETLLSEKSDLGTPLVTTLKRFLLGYRR